MVLSLRPLEWLWRGRAIRAVRARLASAEGSRMVRQQAQLALAQGLRAEEPSEPFAPGPDLAAACQRYAEAARCALAALKGGAWDASSALGSSAEALLAAAGGDATRLAHLQALAEAASAALPAAEQARAATELRTFAAALVTAASSDERQLARLRGQRRWRLSACVALLALAGWHASSALDGLDLREDLAAGKPWRASSAALQCDPEAKRCGNYFGMTLLFHTAEDASPWFVIDLEQEQTISALRVRNRTDCCSWLAVPLVVELSSDQRSWREVARRERNFRDWLPSFAPTAARWVRLRVDRQSMLHLERVSVYR